ncbi:TonB-linked SusC/RagA family outer membrane protein [Butyricimonas faecihominis]|jgi:tonB-linked outer membrane protein, susC/ragA family|uniref:TonB-linked SusC/RagA family outer membrane protein n=2 Tax=Odoribacteraceae TaxID=1853231 RepID=A0A7W6HZ94_9BACT|nr:SusC/RagA family TonB-linked outer membrane protein [Butyricimonas faecihominis]MBB4027747.1 TonB-linked SusC/RagA family outer membrane protein [Butyricimonas faecihominis]
MKKKSKDGTSRCGKVTCKFWKVMRLQLLMIFVTLFQLHAENSYTQQKVSILFKDAAIEEVIKAVEAQSGYVVVYNNTLLKTVKRVTVTLRDVNAVEALNEALKGSGLHCKLVENFLVIAKDNVKTAPEDDKGRRIEGKVTDKDKMPLPGVTVLVKGTKLGVVTDTAGKFQLTLPLEKEVTLQFSFIGMKAQEVKIKDYKPLSIVLEEEATEVEEVVVNGIFQRKAGSFTGSALTMKGEDLKRVSNSNVFASLKNLDPSLMIFDNLEFGSDPNKMPTMALRGKTAFDLGSDDIDLKGSYANDPNAPLFILDGFEASVQKIADLDMNRVESLTILKDASAKAIYGSKAANGVIVIETKKNTESSLRISYSGSVEIQAPDLSSYNLTNAAEKLEIEKDAGLYYDKNLSTLFNLQKDYNKKLAAVVSGIDTDWLSKPLRNGVGTKHGISFEMGNERLNLIVGFSYNNVQGTMKGSDRTNYEGSVSISYRYKGLNFRDNLTITSNVANDSPYGAFSEYAVLNPYLSPYDEKGNLVQNASIIPGADNFEANPLYNASLNTKLTSKYLDVTNNFSVEWMIVMGWKVTGRFGITEKRVRADEFYPANHLKFRSYSGEDLFRKGSYQMNEGEEKRMSGDVNMQFSQQFGDKHYVFANAGFTLSEAYYEELIYKAEGFPHDRMNDMMFARQYVKDTKPTGRESTIRDIAVLFAGNYAYDDRFLVDGSFRTSASSQYGKNNRWGQFWSVGVGWNIHNEVWLKDSKIQQLKLRGSVGYTGAQSSEAYASLATYEYDLERVYMGFLGSKLKAMRNEDLKWKEKFDYNVGLDFNIGRLFSMKFDYYIGKTKNNLLDFDIPTYTGFKTVKENVGDVENKGFDLRLSITPWNMPRERAYFTITTAISRNKNKITGVSAAMQNYNDKQDEVASSVFYNKPVQKYYDGVSLDAIWAVRSLGIDPTNGQEIYLDKKGNRTYTYRVSDQVVCGDKLPDFQGTAGFMFSYKGIELNATFRFQYGAQMYNQTLVDKVENASLKGNVDKRVYDGRWRNPGDLKPYKTLGNQWVAEEGEYKDEKTQATSRFVQDRNELSLSSLRVGYDFWKHNFIKKVAMERLRVEFYMNDVFMLSSIKTERGTAYPFARSFNFAIQATF